MLISCVNVKAYRKYFNLVIDVFGTGSEAEVNEFWIHTNNRDAMLFFFFHTRLDKPWSQVSSLLPPGSCLQFGFSNPAARRFFVECC